LPVGKLLLSAELYPVVHSQAATLNPIDGNAAISGWAASEVDRNILFVKTSKSNTKRRKESPKTEFISVTSLRHNSLQIFQKIFIIRVGGSFSKQQQ